MGGSLGVPIGDGVIASYPSKKIVPVIKRSFDEGAWKKLFHSQVLADWNTVIDMANRIFDELKN